jgi:hypothetical protein
MMTVRAPAASTTTVRDRLVVTAMLRLALALVTMIVRDLPAVITIHRRAPAPVMMIVRDLPVVIPMLRVDVPAAASVTKNGVTSPPILAEKITLLPTTAC